MVSASVRKNSETDAPYQARDAPCGWPCTSYPFTFFVLAEVSSLAVRKGKTQYFGDSTNYLLVIRVTQSRRMSTDSLQGSLNSTFLLVPVILPSSYARIVDPSDCDCNAAGRSDEEEQGRRMKEEGGSADD
jgi:hypothetical protein